MQLAPAHKRVAYSIVSSEQITALHDACCMQLSHDMRAVKVLVSRSVLL